MPTISAVGVARPRAQGQAMTRTAMPNRRENRKTEEPAGTQSSGYEPADAMKTVSRTAAWRTAVLVNLMVGQRIRGIKEGMAGLNQERPPKRLPSPEIPARYHDSHVAKAATIMLGTNSADSLSAYACGFMTARRRRWVAGGSSFQMLSDCVPHPECRNMQVSGRPHEQVSGRPHERLWTCLDGSLAHLCALHQLDNLQGRACTGMACVACR